MPTLEVVHDLRPSDADVPAQSSTPTLIEVPNVQVVVGVQGYAVPVPLVGVWVPVADVPVTVFLTSDDFWFENSLTRSFGPASLHFSQGSILF